MPIYKKFGLIKIDEARIDETCSAYFKWKDLNTYIKSNSNRGINMPDAISEPMGCYCLDLMWNRGAEVGDATNPRTKEKVEMHLFLLVLEELIRDLNKQVALKQYTLMSLTHILQKPLKKTLILKLTSGILTKYRVMKFPILM